MSNPPPQSSGPVVVSYARELGNSRTTAMRWAGVAAAMLLQLALWLVAIHSFYGTMTSSSSSGGGGGSGSGGSLGFYDVLGIVIVLCIGLFLVFVPSIAAAALAPKQPFLIGAVTAAIPDLIALAEYPHYRKLPDSEGVPIVVVFVSVLTLLVAILPTVLIRRRLMRVHARNAERMAANPYAPVNGNDSNSDSAWPPPPSLS